MLVLRRRDSEHVQPLSCLSWLLILLFHFAQDRSQARSMVITRYGIVATEHPLASQIGVSILAQGGNAVDAAVAANAAMGFRANGQWHRGDLFAIVYEPGAASCMA